ncbi:hypothetical protein [uncultured Cohaesibacter sp.]|uniref:hypothetical protein n=1 Tax=uncultured Cohaesibacter sp. TaxID=1002546 RepID=UPI0029C83564|nr:hypothetical protein [uncultured Cohaesibacter sp.]
MTPCTLDFPLSIGERVFHPRLRTVGTVIALSMSECAKNPKAQIEYLNKAGELKSTWAFCDLLQQPEQRSTAPLPSKNTLEGAPS